MARKRQVRFYTTSRGLIGACWPMRVIDTDYHLAEAQSDLSGALRLVNGILGAGNWEVAKSEKRDHLRNERDANRELCNTLRDIGRSVDSRLAYDTGADITDGAMDWEK